MSYTQRIERAPDFTKALGIILVVFGHVLRGLMASGLIEKNHFWLAIDHMIYLFHMPLFFYVSGLFFELLLKRLGYSSLFKRNIYSLLIPLVIWSYLQFSLQYFASSSTNIHISLLDVLTAFIPPREQFWFLAVLFAIMALVGILVVIVKNPHPVFWAIMLSGFLFILFKKDELEAFIITSQYDFLVTEILWQTPYFILGILIHPRIVRSWRINNVGCLLIFSIALWAYQNISIFPNAVYVIASILCILSVFKFMTNLDGALDNIAGEWAKIMSFIGMNTMIIYLAHVIISAAYRIGMIKLGVVNIAVHLIGGTVIGVLMPLTLVPIGMYWSRYMPRLAHAILPVRYSRHSIKHGTN